MDKEALQYLNDHQNYAIIGMSDNPKRYSYKIFMKLLEKGKNVYGINPIYDEIEGHHIYNELSDVGKPIDCVILIVNPSIGIDYLHETFTLGIKTLWLQPGSVSEEITEKAKFLRLNVIKDCVLHLYNYENY